MMEKEIIETYRFNPADFNKKGRRISDGVTFREVVKTFERDFHERHSAEYALNFYANGRTMHLLERSNDAAPFLLYGIDLTQGTAFDAVQDPNLNHEIEEYSGKYFVYAIDSAFMTEFDEYGYPVFDENSDIYPLTLLVDNTMKDGELRLAVPTVDDGDEAETVDIDLPQVEYA